MFEKISRDVKLDAVIMEEKGVKRVQVAAVLGISESTIGRAMRNKVNHGDVEGEQKKRGPKPAFPRGIQDVNSLFNLQFILIVLGASSYGFECTRCISSRVRSKASREIQD